MSSTTTQATPKHNTTIIFTRDLFLLAMACAIYLFAYLETRSHSFPHSQSCSSGSGLDDAWAGIITDGGLWGQTLLGVGRKEGAGEEVGV